MYRVYLIDDEPIIQLGIRKMIPWDDTPYQLCGTAPNGKEALDYIQNNPVDMIITDLKMPIMDGITLIRTLKANQNHTPVLVLSNYSDFDLVREALLEGAIDYLLKVNLSGENLLQQLDKMAALVERTQEDQLQKQQQEIMLAKKNREVFHSGLRSFFLDRHYTYDDLCEQVDFPEYFALPFLIMTIHFREKDIKKEKMHRILPHIESIVAAVFSPYKAVLIYLHHNELLCIVSDFLLPAEQFLPQIGQLRRQLATYFSSAPVLCYKENVEDVCQLKESYAQCLTAFQLHFYQPDLFVIPVTAKQISREQSIQTQDALISMILEDIHSGNIPLLNEHISGQLTRWSQQPLDPVIAKQLCYNALDYIRYSGSIAGFPKAVLDNQEKLMSVDSAAELEALFLSSLHMICEICGTSFSSYKDEIQTVLIYLHTHYTEKISLDSIADAVSLNRSYLCRLFKKELGKSIFSYLNQLRLEKAAHILKTNKHAYIREVAEQVGIEEPFYFTRKFKEYYGVSPREYAAK